MPLYDRNQNSCEKRNDLIKFSPIHLGSHHTSTSFAILKAFLVRTHTSKVAANLINLAYIIECKLRTDLCTTAKANLFCATEKTR
jgi:hypothetical protein